MLDDNSISSYLSAIRRSFQYHQVSDRGVVAKGKTTGGRKRAKGEEWDEELKEESLVAREIEKCGTRGAINLAAVVRLAHWTFRLSLYGDLSLRPNSTANVPTAHGRNISLFPSCFLAGLSSACSPGFLVFFHLRLHLLLSTLRPIAIPVPWTLYCFYQRAPLDLYIYMFCSALFSARRAAERVAPATRASRGSGVALQGTHLAGTGWI